MKKKCALFFIMLIMLVNTFAGFAASSPAAAVHPSQLRLKLPPALPGEIPFTSDAKLTSVVDDSSHKAGEQSIYIMYTSGKSKSDIKALYTSFMKGAENVNKFDQDGTWLLTGKLKVYTLTVSIIGNTVALKVDPDNGVFTEYHLAKSSGVSSPVKVTAQDTSSWSLSAAAASGNVTPGMLLGIKKDGSLWGFGLGLVMEDKEKTEQNIQYYDTIYCSHKGTKTPLKLAEGVKFAAAAPGSTASMTAYFYITKNGDLTSVGSDISGRLGQGEEDGVWYKYFRPKVILKNVRFVEAGSYNTVAITNKNELYVWGANDYNQVSKDSETSYTTPVKVMDNVVSAAVTNSAVLAVKTNGTLWAWGSGEGAQLGDGYVLPKRSTPFKVMEKVKQVYAGEMGTVGAVRTDGSLWMWGYNYFGMAGNGKRGEDVARPVKVMDKVKRVDIGYNHILVLKTDGTVWAWGQNLGGECGLSLKTEFVLKPRKLCVNAADVAATTGESYVLKTDGRVWGCGVNTYSYALAGKGVRNQVALVSTGFSIK